MLTLRAEPLTPDAFRDFGEVIDRRNSRSFPINEGRTRRYHDLMQFEGLGSGAKVLVNIFLSQPVDIPLTLEFLERHPMGSQAFIPMHEERFLVVVAPEGDALDPQKIRAFVSDGRQGVNYRAGTWHAVHSVLDREGEFLVIDRGGHGNNVDTHRIDIQITL